MTEKQIAAAYTRLMRKIVPGVVFKPVRGRKALKIEKRPDKFDMLDHRDALLMAVQSNKLPMRDIALFDGGDLMLEFPDVLDRDMPPPNYEEKYKRLISNIEASRPHKGPLYLAGPLDLGETYDEIVESLTRIGEAGIPLILNARAHIPRIKLHGAARKRFLAGKRKALAKK